MKNIKIPNIFLPYKNDEDLIAGTFITFIEKNDMESIRFLLQNPKNDPTTHDNHVFIYASTNGYVESVKLLLQDKRIDPSVYNNISIKYSSYNGHTKVVKLLLQDKRVDPSSWNNWSIKVASKNGHIEIVKLLLQDDRVWDKLSIEEKKKYSLLCRRNKLIKLMNKVNEK